MGRRAVHVVLLVAALVAVLASTRLTTTGVIGTAAVDPGDPPPTVGTCLQDAVYPVFDGRGWMDPLPEYLPVDCSLPHWGEVYGILDVPTEQVASGLATCWASDALQTYLTGRTTDATWSAALLYDVTATGPDAQQYLGGQRWAACIVHGSEPFTGPLAGVAAADDPPPTLGRCYVDDFAAFDARDLPCREPHRGELFAYRDLDVSAAPTREDVDRWCARVVSQATGRSDLTGLVVQASVFAWFDGIQSRFVGLPLPANTKGATALCGVRAGDDRSLAASLRQVGDGPLPWAD